jgi:transcription initiation factor TFIID TATA-box-binding protein
MSLKGLSIHVKPVPFDFKGLDRKLNEKKPRFYIVNVVGTGILKRSIPGSWSTIDCKKVLENVKGTYIKPGTPAIVHKLPDKSSTALIFKSGKIVITGARSEEQFKPELEKHLEILKTCVHNDLYLESFEIYNVVSKGKIHFDYSLVEMSKNEENCHFEPENYAGLSYRNRDLNVTLTIFSTGIVNLTGAKSEKIAEQAFKDIIPILEKYKTNNTLWCGGKRTIESTILADVFKKRKIQKMTSK